MERRLKLSPTQKLACIPAAKRTHVNGPGAWADRRRMDGWREWGKKEKRDGKKSSDGQTKQRRCNPHLVRKKQRIKGEPHIPNL